MTPQRKPATKAELRREIEELRHVGYQMSNVCFNLGQRHDANRPALAELGPLRNYDAQAMRELQKQWDAIKRSERNA